MCSNKHHQTVHTSIQLYLLVRPGGGVLGKTSVVEICGVALRSEHASSPIVCSELYLLLSSQVFIEQGVWGLGFGVWGLGFGRSEEHTSELQSQSNLVCRLLLEKKK